MKRMTHKMKVTSASMSLGLLLLGALLTATAPSFLVAQEDELDADAIAQKLSNPAAANWSMGLNFDFTSFGGDLPGAGSQSSVGLLFQPALPTALPSIGYNLLFRPAVPLFFNQPLYNSATGQFESSGFQLGDIGFDLALGTTTPGGLLYFYGLVGNVPVGTTDELKGQWAFGPEGALGIIRSWGVIGALVSQKWDVEGGDRETSVFGGQYFYAFGLGGGWQLAAGPTFSYDWVGENFVFPLGTGIATTKILGTMPLKMSTQIWYYLARSDAFGSDWVLRISLTPVVRALW